MTWTVDVDDQDDVLAMLTAIRETLKEAITNIEDLETFQGVKKLDELVSWIDNTV